MPLSLMPVLTRSEIEHIHERSLDLLERVGIDYQTPRALEVLERHGCRVDYERTWASLPRDFVEWAIEQAPRIVRLEARDPSRSVVLDGQRPYHTTDSQGTRAIDFETGERLPSNEESLPHRRPARFRMRRPARNRSCRSDLRPRIVGVPGRRPFAWRPRLSSLRPSRNARGTAYPPRCSSTGPRRRRPRRCRPCREGPSTKQTRRCGSARP